jgi:biopolymer transport protein ExbB/TolQ
MNTNVLMQKLVLIAPLVARTVLYVLIGLSVLSIGVIIERWWFFRRRRDDLAPLTEGVRKALARGDLAEAKKLLAASPSVEAEIVAEAVGWYHEGVDAVEQILVKATRVRRKRFEAGLLFLGTLGNNAPFIGLLGTVLGIMHAFANLSAQSGQVSTEVMAGISEALVSTGIGLFVALPAVIAFNWFQRSLKARVVAAESLSGALLAQLRRTPAADRGALVIAEAA